MMVHFRECLLLNASFFITLIAGSYVFKKGGAKDERIGNLYLLALLSLILLVIPVSATCIRILVGTYYDAPDIWTILPLIPVGAVFLSYLSVTVSEYLDKDKKWEVIFGTALLAGALLLCGSLGNAGSQAGGRYEAASLGEKEAAEYIFANYSQTGNAITVVASDNITASLHALSADVITLYGRDMWDGRLTKNRIGTYPDEITELHSMVLSTDCSDCESILNLCRRAFLLGADMVVVPAECDTAAFETEGLHYTEFTASSGESFYLISGDIL